MFQTECRKEYPRLALNKWATRFAVLLSLPIVLFGFFISLAATLTNNQVAKIEGYEIGDGLYLVLGYPLTGIIHIFAGPGGLRDADSWWALPLLTILFLFQWVIWGQLIVLIGRMFRYLLLRALPSRPSLHVWPDRIVKADGCRFRLKTSPNVTLRSLRCAEGKRD
jgi:hypothetical protein